MKLIHLATCLALLQVACACTTQNSECANPSNMVQTRQCAAKDLDTVRQELEQEVSSIATELVTSGGEASSAKFLALQAKWSELVDAQCRHERELHGRGSMASLSEITCKDHMTRQRLETLSALYKNTISPL